MGWADLLQEVETVTVPWMGGKSIYKERRRWSIDGDRPPEFGWHTFEVTGNRKAKWKEMIDPDTIPHGWEEKQSTWEGYLIGHRLISDKIWRVNDNPKETLWSSDLIYFVEPGLERFSRAKVAQYEGRQCIFVSQAFPLGPESEVMAAFQDRKENIDHIPNVTPALNIAYQFEMHMRERLEERRRKIREEREAEERQQRIMEQIGTGAGRRALAAVDFHEGAKAALLVSGAELLDERDGYNANEKVVQFRFMRRRFECVVDRNTLRVTDAGICLTDYNGTRGDDRFTLESLPSVIKEAIDTGVLHVYRRVAGDEGDDW